MSCDRLRHFLVNVEEPLPCVRYPCLLMLHEALIRRDAAWHFCVLAHTKELLLFV